MSAQHESTGSPLLLLGQHQRRKQSKRRRQLEGTKATCCVCFQGFFRTRGQSKFRKNSWEAGRFPAGPCDDKLSLSGQYLVALLPCQRQAGFSAQIIFRVNAVSLVCFA